jgi:hypothetical protein
MLKQKFRRGNLVHIKKGTCPAYFEQGRDAIIIGSYDDLYGGGNIFEYTVMFEEGGESAWYHGNSLILIDEGGENLIEQAKEKAFIKNAKKVLLECNLNHMYDSDIVTLLRFIGFDYSVSNDYFGLWDEIKPLFKEIKRVSSPNSLKEKYPDYDIEGVWNIFHEAKS